METSLVALSLKPVTILSFLLCVVAVLWCAVMMPKLRFGKDRFVVGLVGMLSVHHGFTMLGQAGVWLGAAPTATGQWVTLGATALYLVTVIILERATTENRRNQFRLRLAEGNQAPPPKPVMRGRSGENSPGVSPHMTDAVIESSPLAMFAVDANGAICCWNTAAEKEFGWSKSEVIGRETPFGGAEQLRRKDGSEVQASIWTAPVDLHGALGQGRLTIVANHG
ncbi:MAG: PAS domain S-box protein [Bryobacteraceae bacterium]